MWLSIIALLMIVVIAYLQILQGVFGATVMAVLAVLCAVGAFGFYDSIATSFLLDVHADWALSIALMGLFFVPMLILRLVTDKYISRPIWLPVLLDRIGGGAAAFLTGMVVTGTTMVAIQLLPLPADFMGFPRFDESGKRQNLWLQPDAFTIGLVSTIMEGSMSGGGSFTGEHPDLLKEIAWRRSGHSGSAHVVPPRSVSLEQVRQIHSLFDKEWTGRGRDKKVIYEALDPPPTGYMWIACKCRLSSAAADSDQAFRFAPQQVTLVGSEPGKRGGQVYHICGVNDPDNPVKHVALDPSTVWGGKTDEYDFVFEIPEEFEGDYLTFKRARVDMIPIGQDVEFETEEQPDDEVNYEEWEPDEDLDEEEAEEAKPDKQSGRRKSGKEKGDRVSGATPTSQIGFSTDLPFELTQYSGHGIETQGSPGLLVSGKLWAKVAKQGKKGRKTPIVGFAEPEDLRLLQVHAEKLQAGSTLGQALSFVVDSVKNIYIRDDQDQKYKVVGCYAIANVNRDQIIEVQYIPDAETTGQRLQDFDRIKSSHLKDDCTLVYLFLVEPGTVPVAFSAGRKEIDISELNLVAPD